jgi:hypothetical protein
VVSEITDKLSPNIEPPINAAITSGICKPPFSANPTAIGPTATIVPTDVPVANEIKHAIIKIPAVIYCAGTKVNAKFTVDSTAPIDDETVENAPARMKIIHIIIIFSSPHPLINVLNLSSMLPLNIINANIIATSAATGAGN